ncbi:MAG: VWA domain-containing protein [Anaerolineae bacterium]|nr:VWA domain-containing protein [Anaerolineae bacterium]
MAINQHLYTILGVPPDASPEEIKRAYRLGAQRFHPDANPHPGAAIQFREIASAYETLSNSARRAEYDRQRRSIADRRPYFTVHVTPSRRVVTLLDEPQVLYLLTEVAPGRPETKPREVVVNLTLIIDRSTSMKGARLDQVKAAAHHIIDNLNEADIISIVSFSDRAEVVVKATPVGRSERLTLKALVSTMQANGGTEIFKGLDQGFREIKKYLNKQHVNHMVLLTDGQTYGDEEACFALAEKSTQLGVAISGLGIGQDWNDVFLDKLTSRTGGTSTYIDSPKVVRKFLEEHVRNLSQAYAERVQFSVAPDADVILESAFKITPSPMPLPLDVQPIPIGALEYNRPVSVLLQFQLPRLTRDGARPMARLDVTGDIMAADLEDYKAINDVAIEVAANPPAESPPPSILNALGKLTLYRMQEKAQEAIARGDVAEATQKLNNLATRLLAGGQEELAAAARTEAMRVSQTHALSDEGSKMLKYGTRALLLPPPEEPAQQG